MSSTYAQSSRRLQDLQRLVTKEQPRIGCSLVAAAIGRSRFEDSTPLAAYRRIVEGEKLEPNKSMLLGRYFEDGVRNMLAEQYGITCIEPQRFVSQHPLVGYVDGTINDSTILEIKTTARGYDDLPEEYKIQANLYMLLLQAQLCTFAVFTFSTQELDIYTIAFDDSYTAEIIEQLAAFYRNHVIPKIPPQPRQAKEYRRTVEVDDSRTVEIKNVTLLQQIAQLKQEQNFLEKKLDELKFQLELELAGASKGTCRGKTIASYSQVNYKRVDADVLKIRYPDIYKECIKEEPQLRFTIKYNHIEELFHDSVD